MPDNGNAIYHGRKGRDTNEPLAHYKQFLVSDLGRSVNIGDHNKYPKPGYMNGPAFCENRDKSMGTYSFNIPDDFVQGFNSLTSVVKCFATIVISVKHFIYALFYIRL